MSITVRGRVGAGEAEAVLGLAGAAEAADGAGPLSEDVRLHLRYGGDQAARTLLAYADGDLAGFAHLSGPVPDEERSGELAVHPRWRRRGVGLALARALREQAGGEPVRVWAHGDLPAAARLAAAAGFTRVRALWQMRRPLSGPLPEPRVPDQVRLRTFVPGRDEHAWLGLNALAFADHPEQGRWTAQDLRRREGEAWFDPTGFFLAERGTRLVGFHWTKVHGRTAPEQARHAPATGPPAAEPATSAPVGEVYVVGVDPAERGSGLGRALTLAGLRHLRERGLAEVMLYVDESNTAAIGLYRRLGFSRTATDVMYSSAPAPGAR